MKDQEIHAHIETLIAEEHQLVDRGGRRSRADQERLDSIGVQLDRYWDLLRQRRARRDAGQDPDIAHIRPEEVVENYEQ
jgi:hypothetical protein